MSGQKIPISTALFEGENSILGPQNFFNFYLSLIFTLLHPFMCLTLMVKKFELWWARLGGNPHGGTSNFC